MNKKLLFIIIISTCVSSYAFGQVKSDSLEKVFNEFKSNIQTDFNQFKATNDSVFIGFLRESWEEYELLRAERPIQNKPKPNKQPLIRHQSEDSQIPDSIKKFDFSIDTIVKQKIFKKNIIEKKSINFLKSKKEINCSFYGTDIEFELPESDLPILEKVSNIAIANFYEDALNSDLFEMMLKKSHYYKKKLKLNDWGYLKLCEQISREIYIDCSSQTTALWFLLISAGQKVKIAYFENEIYLLCAFDSPVYNISYCIINGESYSIYSIDELKQEFNKFYTYKENHNLQKNAISLYLTENPIFNLEPSLKRIQYMDRIIELKINKNLIDFYSGYPDCGLEVTLGAPLSNETITSLDAYFAIKMNQMSDDLQRIEYLLNFIQHALPYKTDSDQFGKENYLFAEEALFYPYCDCEDRVALMAQLTKRYTSFKSIGLNFLGHVSFAVNLNTEIDGAFITVDNEKYYVCDPTYINASCGSIMPEFVNTKPEIIYIN